MLLWQRQRRPELPRPLPRGSGKAGNKPGYAGPEGQGFALLAGPASLRAARAVLPASFPVPLLLAGWIFSFPVFLSLPSFT